MVQPLRARLHPLALLAAVALLAVCPAQDPLPQDVGLSDRGADASDLAATPDAPLPDLALPPPDRAADATPAALKVLFIGNSYTFVNDLPKWVSALATAAKAPPTITVDSATAGGATMKMHWQNAATLAKISSGGWTHVVLQGQSVEPVAAFADFKQHALLLAGKVTQAKARPVMFQTWARKKGHAVYGYSWSGGNPAAMQKGLRDAYAAVAQASNGLVAPVGDAWAAVIAANPAMELFSPDGSHPSERGTYLAACVFYARLTGRSPVGLAAKPAAITPAAAKILQQAALKAMGGK